MDRETLTHIWNNAEGFAQYLDQWGETSDRTRLLAAMIARKNELSEEEQEEYLNGMLDYLEGLE